MRSEGVFQNFSSVQGFIFTYMEGVSSNINITYPIEQNDSYIISRAIDLVDLNYNESLP
jgi:hypothetical protein